MAKAPVLCPYCGQMFNREKEDFVVIGRRYAHRQCNEWVQKLYEYMREKCGAAFSQQKVNQQITKYIRENGYTSKDIYYAMVYWFDVKKEDPEKAMGGIGIVPYIFAESVRYWKNKENNSQINIGKHIEDYVNMEPEKIIIHPTPIKKPRRVKLFHLE